MVVLISTARGGFWTKSSHSTLILTIMQSFIKKSRVENSTSGASRAAEMSTTNLSVAFSHA